jgi:hypothetical protein
MQDRETKELKTAAGTPFAIKAWLTAREKREVDVAPLRFMRIGAEQMPDGRMGAGMQGYDAAAATVAKDDELIKQAVLSFAGSAEDVLGRLLDAPAAELESVLSAVRPLVENPTTTE